MGDEQLREQLTHIWPEVIGLVITKRDGRINACPINYQAVSTAYEQPLSVCIGLNNESYSLESLLLAGEFTYAYPAKAQVKSALYCGTVSGRDVDKIHATDLQFDEPESVATPLLQGAVANYECKVLHHHKVGVYTVVIGEVLRLHTYGKSNFDKLYNFGRGSADQPGGYGIVQVGEILQKDRESSPEL